MPNKVDDALRKAKSIDNPGSGNAPFPANSGLGRAQRATNAEKSGGPTAAARIFPANGSRGQLETGAGMRDIELHAPAAEIMDRHRANNGLPQAHGESVKGTHPAHKK